MSPRDLAAVGLRDNCIYLAASGTMLPRPRTARSREGCSDGRVLALRQVNGPGDVHYPVWEMHPAGAELLIAATGLLSVEWREDDVTKSALLPAEGAFIVPAGTWHRLVVHEPSLLIAITPRQGTVHRRD